MAGPVAFTPRDPDWERRCRDSFARQQYMTLIGGQISPLRRANARSRSV